MSSHRVAQMFSHPTIRMDSKCSCPAFYCAPCNRDIPVRTEYRFPQWTPRVRRSAESDEKGPLAGFVGTIWSIPAVFSAVKKIWAHLIKNLVCVPLRYAILS